MSPMLCNRVLPLLNSAPTLHCHQQWPCSAGRTQSHSHCNRTRPICITALNHVPKEEARILFQSSIKLYISIITHSKQLSESEVAQSCPTLCDPTDCSLPGSSVHEIFQAIVLEWTAIFFSLSSLKQPLIFVVITNNHRKN